MAILVVLGSITAVAISGYGCAQITPAHEIRAKPAFIHAGIQVGDLVEITTNDGKYRKFVVEDVATNTIEGPTETIRFSDIQRIVKRSWKEPTHPCGGGLPVGCSVPEVILILSEDYQEQAEKFHPACVTHDFCYRHGFATYGATRKACDTAILDEMKAACAGPRGLNMLDVEGFALCRLAATQTYEAIRDYGEKHFQTVTSSYCEYREDP